MEMALLKELGTGAVFLLIVIKLALDFIKGRKRDDNGNSKEIEKVKMVVYELRDQLNDLHEWHNVRDNDGVPIWYVRRSLEEAINKLAENIAMQTQLFQKWISEK